MDFNRVYNMDALKGLKAREEKYFKIAQDRINYYLEKNIKKLELYLDAK